MRFVLFIFFEDVTKYENIDIFNILYDKILQ